MTKDYISKAYEHAVKNKEITEDKSQRQIIQFLDNLASALNKKKFFNFNNNKHKSLYLYGPVGRGKTFLTQMFLKSIKTAKKQRVHFHQFIQEVDNDLKKLQGKANPLKIVATQIAKTSKVLVIDEFLVKDIAEAMILTQLLPELLAHNITIIITSNTEPKDLYLHGLHRQRFLPTIKLIYENFAVLNLAGLVDYRLQGIEKIDAYIWPLGKDTEKKMLREFELFTKEFTENTLITIQNRTILAKRVGNNAIWFDFSVICNIPRSEFDYLELADKYKTFFISDVEVLSENNNKALLFIKLIDVLYDKNIKLIVSAKVPITELYPNGPLLHDFARTVSRLEEMRTIKYLTS